MKTLIFLTTLLFICSIVNSQQQPPKDYYLEKSKKKKTVAWVLLGTGTAAIITGLIMVKPHEKGVEPSYTPFFFEAGGFLVSLVSVPFFISARTNKKRAANVSLNMDRVFVPADNSISLKNHPRLSLHIPIGD